MVPLKVSGSTSQSGRRNGVARRIAAQTARPMTGRMSSTAGNFRLAITLARMAVTRISGNDGNAHPFDVEIGRCFFDDRRIAVLLQRRRNAEDDEGDSGRDKGLEHAERAHAVDPHHGRGGVANHASRAAGIGGRDDGREIADVHLAAEHLLRHGAADQGGGDVVEKARDHGHEARAARRPPFQSSGRKRGISSGTRLFSKCRDNSAKPISNKNRLARITHSCARWPARPCQPSPNLKPVKASL